jgi:hypothetical protein
MSNEPIKLIQALTILTCIHEINYLSVSRQVNSLFQTEFSKECDLELPPSTQFEYPPGQTLSQGFFMVLLRLGREPVFST